MGSPNFHRAGACCARSPLPARWALSIIGFLGFTFVYALRINMSMAIVCMVNATSGETPGENSSNPTTAPGEDDCGELEDNKPAYEGEFDWDSDIQGHILSSFFYGYLVIQVPAGWLSGRFGAKLVYIVGMALSALATILIPVCARANVYLTIVMRVLIGIGTGVSFPAMNAMWGEWAPPLERSKLMTFCNAGTTFGNILTLTLSGLMCSVKFDNGWPLIFYVFGGGTVVWLIFFCIFAYDSPADHPCMKESEKEYITESIGLTNKDNKEPPTVPWLSIIRSLPVWAIIVAHVCNNWGGYMLLTSLPKYMAEVLRFDIKSNGLLSAMPYIVQIVAAIAGGQFADCLREKEILSTTSTRKIFQAVSFVGQGVFMVSAGFVTCNQRIVAVVLLAVAVGFTFGSRSGYAINHVDLAARHAGVLYGITNTVATVPGIVAPIIVGKLTPNGTRAEWQIVFYITGAVFAFGAIVYVIFASGEEQPWARDEKENIVEVSVEDTPYASDNMAATVTEL